MCKTRKVRKTDNVFDTIKYFEFCINRLEKKIKKLERRRERMMQVVDFVGSVCVGLIIISTTIFSTFLAANIVKDKFDDFREWLKSRKE